MTFLLSFVYPNPEVLLCGLCDSVVKPKLLNFSVNSLRRSSSYGGQACPPKLNAKVGASVVKK